MDAPNLDIPDFLKIPQEVRNASWGGGLRRGIVTPEVTNEQKVRYTRKIMRRLRAEVRQIVEQIDKIDGRNAPVTKQLEEKLAKVYAELAVADDNP